MIKISGVEALLEDSGFQTEVLKLLGKGASSRLESGKLIYEIPYLTSGLIPSKMATYAGSGVETENLPAFLSLTSEQYDSEIPAGMPNEWKDEDQTERRKWSEWKDSTHSHADLTNGNKGIPLNGFGRDLKGSELKLVQDAGYTLLSQSEYKALLPSGE